MKTYKTEGIVIRRRNLGEADKIVTIFTRKFGKLQVKAPGVRKITSRRSPHIELLNHVSLSLYIGRNLPIITEAESIDTFSDIKVDLKKVAAAYHLCELIDNLCPENQENYEVFMLLKDTFSKLTNGVDKKELVRGFELNLLSMLGYIKSIPVSSSFETIPFIEELLEKKLKARQIAPFLS
ncbi:MAG TPA: DNA repair protein RecO [Patescibacteria group bacterium]|nr:DNA repair protein RecO [Patescibacteria group bacterium]